MSHEDRRTGTRHPARHEALALGRSCGRALAVACALVVGAWTSASATLYTSTTTPLAPVPGDNNQAVLTLTNITPGLCLPTCASDTETSYVQPGSAIGLTYDTLTHTVTITSATLFMSDVTYFPFLQIHVSDILFELDPLAPAPQGVVDPITGALSMTIPAVASATVFNSTYGDAVDVPVTGTFTVDIPAGGPSNTMALTNPSTEISAVDFEFAIGPTNFVFRLTGTVTFHFQGTFLTLFDDAFDAGTLDAWSAHVP